MWAWTSLIRGLGHVLHVIPGPGGSDQEVGPGS